MLDFPPELRGAEFAVIRFQLEFQDACTISRKDLLSLRRDLLQAAHLVLDGDPVFSVAKDRFSALFDPPLPADPVALRRHQRPGAPFAILAVPNDAGEYDAGDQLDLEVVFWGRGILSIADFTRTLCAFGHQGIHCGEGPFELTAVFAEDPAGNRSRIWREGEDLETLAPPLCNPLWWLESRLPAGNVAALEFLTPARILSHRKPIFRPSFDKLFPFILRRVTSVMNTHCGVEINLDPQSLLRSAEGVSILENGLRWEDWRSLAGEEKNQELGGIQGRITLEGEALADIFWVLKLGTLMNVGKNAAFGAGHYRLRFLNS